MPSAEQPAQGEQPAHPARGARWRAIRNLVAAAIAARATRDVADRLLPGSDPDASPPRADGAPSAIATATTFGELALLYPRLLARDHRKRHGAWFTPPDLAAPTVRRALAPLLARPDAEPLRICDPAVGGGTFLLAALAELVQAGVPPGRAVLCLHGVDVDETAAALAALALWEACGADRPDPLAIAANVRAGDGLMDLPAGTFDAVLTNPPWETLQASRSELAPDTGEGGGDASAAFAAASAAASERATAIRARFCHQGRGKLYTYRLFVERAHQLLRTGGRFGMLVPASLWFDRDAAALRTLLLDRCEWEWLYGFENRRKLFPIDGRYRFAAIVGSKGGRTGAIRTAFGRTDAAGWACAEPRHVAYGRADLAAFSRRAGTFVEVEHARDLELLRRVHANGRIMLGRGGSLEWRQGDFNMTSNAASFVPRMAAEDAGYRRDADAVWRCGAGDPELLPLYQGAMIHDLHPNAGAHASGAGRACRWEPPSGPSDLRPLYLVDAARWRARGAPPAARIGLRALSNATNERTAIACLLPGVPCGNSLGVLHPRGVPARPLLLLAAGAAKLASLPFDWALRLRLTGTNLNRFVLEDCVLPATAPAQDEELARLALRLCAVLPWHGPLWDAARAEGWLPGAWAPATHAVLDRDVRIGLAARIDAIVGAAYGFDRDDVAWIVRDCERPPGARDPAATTERSQRGFWRVDRDLPPAGRRPVRWLALVS
jgi:hypothetical protein